MPRALVWFLLKMACKLISYYKQGVFIQCLILSVWIVDARFPALASTSFVVRPHFINRIDGGVYVGQGVPLRAPTLLGAKTTKPKVGTVERGTMSTTASAVSLTKNIIGAGILSLPFGMAAGDGTGQMSAVTMGIASSLLST